ncbi:MAG: metalloenzyme [Chloroflexales bacterium]|nr:metalloenzyme [Chloroflexales bacterium]
MSLIFVFLDGVGLAPASPSNPLATAMTPAFHALLGGPLTSEQSQQSDNLLLKPIDATLGVPGLPQSGTGHVALLTGVNAPLLIGRHQPNYPPVALRGILAEQSIFRQAQHRGLEVVFANVFTPGYWQALAARRLRRSASLIAAEGASLRLRDLDDLRAGQALMWDITGDALQVRDEGLAVPPVTPKQAGAHLAALSQSCHLVFFESFLPDLAGHGRLPLSDEAALERIDGFLAGLLDALLPGDTLLITSDHGNIEDRRTPVHTRNPAPLLVVGAGVDAFARAETIADIAAVVMNVLA